MYSERLGILTGLGHRHDERYCLAATFEIEVLESSKDVENCKNLGYYFNRYWGEVGFESVCNFHFRELH